MLKNLDVTTYRNGDEIPEVSDAIEWENQSTGAWCYYNNDKGNGEVYSKLYNWYAVEDSRGLAPLGWHIATDAEWTELINYLGGIDVAGGKLKEEGTTHWNSPNTDATNESGFSALPCGVRYQVNASFFDLGKDGEYWTATEHDTGRALYWEMRHNSGGIIQQDGNIGNGRPVRCVKD